MSMTDYRSQYPFNFPFSGPAYVVEEKLLLRNIDLISQVAQQTDVKILMAFKSFASWRLFHFFREKAFHAAVSSLNEAQLALEELDSLGHAFSPSYTKEEFEEWQKLCSHITFNSLSQATELLPYADLKSHKFALRINPHYSPVETLLYNPGVKGSRFGVPASELPPILPQGITGLHVHVLCESNSFHLEHLLAVLERDFSDYLKQIEYINLGGGHLITSPDYNVDHLVQVLKAFKQKHPHLSVFMEPGSAFTYRTGYLLTHVVDIVEHADIKTAIIDASFTCHMPDCLEMPYHPVIRGAELCPETIDRPIDWSKEKINTTSFLYRIGGNSCLSGDFMGAWRFPKALNIGDPILFEDMIHYTTVKTTMFNGISHPSIVLQHVDGSFEMLRRYTYTDYKNRMC